MSVAVVWSAALLCMAALEAFGNQPPVTPPPALQRSSSIQTLEAEDATLTGGVQIEDVQADFRGSGYISGFTEIGHGVTFVFTAPVSGEYFVSLRYIYGPASTEPANNEHDKRLSVSINQRKLSDIILSPAEDEGIWRIKTFRDALEQGINLVEYRLEDDSPQLPLLIDFLWLSRDAGNGIVPQPILASTRQIDIRRFVELPPNAAGNPPRINTMAITGGRMFVGVEYDGHIYEIIEDQTGAVQLRLFLDLKSAVLQSTGRNLSNASTWHGGLRGLAFHPDFAGNGRFYTSFMEDRPLRSDEHRYLSDPENPVGVDSVLVEWTFTPDSETVDPSTYREVFRVGLPFLDHPIKQIHFNPFATPGDADYGLLYIGHGDGSVQSSHSGGGLNNDALGKILRIDPLQKSLDPYSIPATNPFVNDETKLDEIYAIGFRNPHTFSFARIESGQTVLIVDDAGRDNVEEVNLVVAGGNYGWARREGTFMHLPEGGIVEGVLPLRDDDAYNDYIYPAIQWGHVGNPGAGFVGQAIAGGHVVANGSLLDGEYIFADFALSGRLFHVPLEEMHAAITTLDPAESDNDHPSKLTEAQIGEFSIRFDHDDDEATTAMTFSTMLDVIALEPTYDGSGRSDLRFGQGPEGELYILNKRNGWIYLVTNTLPGHVDGGLQPIFLPLIP